MKKTFVSFLILTCLLLSASARLPLLQQSCADQSNQIFSINKLISKSDAQNPSTPRFSVKGKYFRRFFSSARNLILPTAAKIVFTYERSVFFAYAESSFFFTHQYSLFLRSPPVSVCF